LAGTVLNAGRTGYRLQRTFHRVIGKKAAEKFVDDIVGVTEVFGAVWHAIRIYRFIVCGELTPISYVLYSQRRLGRG
jgi:hypothetical protein